MTTRKDGLESKSPVLKRNNPSAFNFPSYDPIKRWAYAASPTNFLLSG